MAVKKRLGEMLIEAGIIGEVQLQAALAHQRRWGGKLGQALVDLRLASEAHIVASLSRKLGYEVANVSSLVLTSELEEALRFVPGDLALRQALLPVAADSSTLTVVMGDPSNITTVDELSFRAGRRIKVMIAGEREITAAVRRFYFDAVQAPLPPLEAPPSEPALDVPIDPFAPATGRADGPRPTAVTSDPFDPGRRSPPAPLPNPPPSGGREGRGEATASGRRSPPAPRAGRVARDLQPAFTPPPVLIPVGSEASSNGPDPFAKTAATRSAPPVGTAEPALRTVRRPTAGALLDALERLARGEESALLRPGQLAAIVARLLTKRGLLDEAELLQELSREVAGPAREQ